MLLSALFAILFIHTSDLRYKVPLEKSLEATYAGMPEKTMLDNKVEEIKNKNRVLTTSSVIGYTALYKKQFSFTTSKVPLINQTSAHYDNFSKSGHINFTFNF